MEGTWAAGARSGEDGGSERGAGEAVVVVLFGAGAAAVVAAAGLAAAGELSVAAEGVWDEVELPCDWVEKAAEAWNYAGL